MQMVEASHRSKTLASVTLTLVAAETEALQPKKEAML